jgi:HEAT repeat protein
MSIRISVIVFWLGVSLVLIGCARDPVDDLIAKLHDSDVEVRRAAVRALVEQPSNDERVVAELTKSATDKDAEVRYQSVDAISKLGSAAKPILPQLKFRLQDTDTNVRLRAAFVIQRIDPADRSFVPVLTGAIRAGDGRTLLEVGKLGPDAAWAVPTLSGLLSHESPKVRTLAARALGGIGPAANSARAALEAARSDSNAAVKHAVKDALARIESGPTTRAAAK